MVLDHIGIAVTNLDSALGLFRELTGTASGAVESLPDLGVRVAFSGSGSGRIELLEPLGTEGPLQRFLNSRGPGLHHIAYQVTDIRAEIERLKLLGYSLTEAQPRIGSGNRLVAFLNPRDTQGILIELCQEPGS